MQASQIVHDIRRHISFVLCSDIGEICRPLFAHTLVKVFEYSRVYPNGARVELSNHAGHMENAFISRAKMSRVYTPALIPSDQRYLFINHWIDTMRHPAKKSLQAQLYSQHELFGIGNELSLIKRSEKYVEYFHFYAASWEDTIENYYLNNLGLFERFSLYFVSAARDIIKKADQDPLLKPWRDVASSQVLVVPHDQDSVNFQKKSFLKSITPKRLFLNIQGREVYLTRRELECADLLVEGKTNRNIAESLFISLRTVETHIESLRNKTGCDERSELISFLKNACYF